MKTTLALVLGAAVLFVLASCQTYEGSKTVIDEMPAVQESPVYLPMPSA